jgi:hypothetical protein
VKPFRVLSPLHKASRQVQIFMAAQCRPLGVSTVEAQFLAIALLKGPVRFLNCSEYWGRRSQP